MQDEMTMKNEKNPQSFFFLTNSHWLFRITYFNSLPFTRKLQARLTSVMRINRQRLLMGEYYSNYEKSKQNLILQNKVSG